MKRTEVLTKKKKMMIEPMSVIERHVLSVEVYELERAVLANE